MKRWLAAILPMKLFAILAGIFFGGLLLLAGILAIWGMGVYNNAAGLRNQYTMRVKTNMAEMDNMWKKISQVVQVNDSHKESLKEIFTSYAEARTGGGDQGSLMKWVQEAIPNTTQLGDTYKQVMNIITGSRDQWTANQRALVSIAEQYNLLLVRFPTNLLLGMFGFEKIDPKVITSSRTENAFETGKDDDVDLKLSK